MEINEKINYWVELSDYDLETAEVLQETQRFLYVCFMCHQVIEKILKALYVSIQNSTPPYTHNLTSLTMDKTEVIKKVKKYAQVVKEKFPVRMIILFGSYARGCAREHSDIDVAVVVDHNDEDYLESRQQLFKLGTDIDCRIEPILIERNQKYHSGFLEEIRKTVEIIYQDQQTVECA